MNDERIKKFKIKAKDIALTPASLHQQLSVIAGFDTSTAFDPCPEHPEADGLLTDWESPAYVNPPFSHARKWVQKSLEQQQKGVTVALLLPWYQFAYRRQAQQWLDNLPNVTYQRVKGDHVFHAALCAKPAFMAVYLVMFHQ